MGEVQRHWWEQQGWISTCSTNVQQDWWRDARSCPYVPWKYLSHCIIRLIKLLHSEESTSDWTWIQRPDQVSIEIPEEGTAEAFTLQLSLLQCRYPVHPQLHECQMTQTWGRRALFSPSTFLNFLCCSKKRNASISQHSSVWKIKTL